jgi:hypothetical protein
MKRQRLAVPALYYGFAGTESQASDLVGQLQDAGVLISSAYNNNRGTHELRFRLKDEGAATVTACRNHAVAQQVFFGRWIRHSPPGVPRSHPNPPRSVPCP